MFPRDFFMDYWDPSLRNEVFVAMPFENRFDPVWGKVIRPAVEEGCGLSANRVDTRISSDSILVDILDGIAHARLVLVDVSPVSCRRCRGIRDLFARTHLTPRYPNGNVMYELGLAHAARQAEEVVVIRNSDEHQLLFDVSGVRVHRYPRDLDAAREKVTEVLPDALKAVDQSKGLRVARAIQSLSLRDVRLIRRFWPFGFTVSAKKTDGDLTGMTTDMGESIADLQRLGMLRVASFPPTAGCGVGLEWTEFSGGVVRALPAAVLAGRPDPVKTAGAVPPGPSEDTEQSAPEPS